MSLATVGKDFVKVVEFVPKEMVRFEHALQDAIIAEPELKADVITIATDVKDIVATGGVDVAAFLAASKLIWPAILAAAAQGGTNITLDLAVLTQVQPLVADTKAFANEIPLLEKLVADGEKFVPAVEKLYGTLKTDLTS